MKIYPQNWSEYFYYDISSPSGLRWNKNVTTRGNYYKYLKDDIAGSIMKDGRWSVCIRINKIQCRFYCHRIIWEMHFDKIPSDKVIDHLDGNKQNNDISNLRLATYSSNNQNRGKDSRNTTGITGVTKVAINGYEYISAYWVNEKNKQIHKHVSISKYGLEIATMMATEIRESAIKELNLLGCEYTDRHGK